jgi:serine phosphatase RsbU (regulator of sigma subunit)
MPGLETTEFRRAFAVETDRLLRSRLLWFVCIWGGLTALVNIPIWIGAIARPFGLEGSLILNLDDWGRRDYLLYGLTQFLLIGAYVSALIAVKKNAIADRGILLMSMALVALDGLNHVAIRAGEVQMFGGAILFFGMTHFVASALFPWSPGQAIKPAALVLLVSAISRLTVEDGPSTQDALAIGFSPLIAAPGVLFCWGRHSRRMERFKYTFVDQRYGKLRQELAYARAIHEALFPQPRTAGSVRLTYKYEPMRQIGGDYLHAAVCPTDDGRDEKLSLVLMDVTGHGIPAALSVNRLHGEMELCFADDPDIGPGEVLRRLNRYVHLTLAKHSIFVTALCLRVDPLNGTIEHASAGHPPAFLRGSDGTIRELESTAIVLGAMADRDFDPAPEVHTFGPGDSLIAYTDGATEARSEKGDMLRVDGLRRLLADPTPIQPGTWPERILDVVYRHRGGHPPEDDTLIVEVYRSMESVRRATDGDGERNEETVEECESVATVGGV